MYVVDKLAGSIHTWSTEEPDRKSAESRRRAAHNVQFRCDGERSSLRTHTCIARLFSSHVLFIWLCVRICSRNSPYQKRDRGHFRLSVSSTDQLSVKRYRGMHTFIMHLKQAFSTKFTDVLH